MDDLTKYLSIEGKATRSEYWAPYLISWLISIPVTLLAAASSFTGKLGMILAGILLLSYGIITCWIMFATVVRRCRDIGINLWFSGTLIIPYVNFIAFIAFGCLPADENKNGSTTNT